MFHLCLIFAEGWEMLRADKKYAKGRDCDDPKA